MWFSLIYLISVISVMSVISLIFLSSAISVISVISVTYMISVVSVISVWFVCYLFLVFVNSAMFFELLDRKHLAQLNKLIEDPMKLNTVLPFTSTHIRPPPSPSACRRVHPSVLAFASWLSLPLPDCQQSPSGCPPAGPPNLPPTSRKPR